jgi:cytochrome c2
MVPRYRHAGPPKRNRLIWTLQSLRDRLIDPRAVVAGSRMPSP